MFIAIHRRGVPALLITALCGLTACGQSAPAASSDSAPMQAEQLADSALEPTAGIQDIMAYMIDPAADFLWESVSTTVTEEGVEEKQPRTDAEWDAVRRQAVILTEAANLILMEGRHVAKEGERLEDHGTPGNLTAAEAEQAIADERAAFVSFSRALHDVGVQMLNAADTRDPQGLLDAGETLDGVCEGCHLKFWYPGQVIPPFPEHAPALGARSPMGNAGA